MKIEVKIITVAIATILLSCKAEAVKDAAKEEVQSEKNEKSAIDGEKKYLETKDLGQGLSITWHEHGEGDSLAVGDLIMIEYKVLLKDSTVVDGNHLINKTTVPFMVGFQMQTKGWDLAMRHLRVGDFATIKIPAPLARGEKGIQGLIPPNADNWLIIRIVDNRVPTREIDGVKVWLIEENKHNKLKFNEENKIVFHAMVSSESTPMYFNSYRTNVPFELKLEDQGTVPGLKKSLINAKKADRMFVYVPASEAYGTKGYLDIVKPNEALFYNLLVLDVLDK